MKPLKGNQGTIKASSRGGFKKNAEKIYHQFGGQGTLLFNGVDGDAEEVSGEKLSNRLQDNRANLFVLNAYKSGEQGDDPFSSVASQLL